MGDPASMALMAGMMGSSLLGGITAPEGQELKSFEGMPGADPGEMFGESKGLLSDYLTALIGDAGRPVKLNTTVNPLPVFKGGALPTSISAGAVDPTRYSPSLRETPGLSIAKRSLSAVTPGRRQPGSDMDRNNPDSPINTKDPVYDESNPYNPSPQSRGSVGDDQASAAAELLASLGGDMGGEDMFNIPDVADPGLRQKRRLTAA